MSAPYPNTRQGFLGAKPWMALAWVESFFGSSYRWWPCANTPFRIRFGNGNRIGTPLRVGTGCSAQSGALYSRSRPPARQRRQLNPWAGQTSASDPTSGRERA